MANPWLISKYLNLKNQGLFIITRPRDISLRDLIESVLNLLGVVIKEEKNMYREMFWECKKLTSQKGEVKTNLP